MLHRASYLIGIRVDGCVRSAWIVDPLQRRSLSAHAAVVLAHEHGLALKNNSGLKDSTYLQRSEWRFAAHVIYNASIEMPPRANHTILGLRLDNIHMYTGSTLWEDMTHDDSNAQIMANGYFSSFMWRRALVVPDV